VSRHVLGDQAIPVELLDESRRAEDGTVALLLSARSIQLTETCIILIIAITVRIIFSSPPVVHPSIARRSQQIELQLILHLREHDSPELSEFSFFV
jgi:hypothetical protein